MAINLSDNIFTSAPKPTDSRYLNNLVPYASVSAANAAITGGVGGVRYTGLTINILGIEYWYCKGIGDANLVIKDSGVANTGITTAINGLTKVGSSVRLGGTLTGSTVIIDSRATPLGIQYNADYCSTFTARSLVDAGYVTGKTGAILTCLNNNFYTKTQINNYTGTTVPNTYYNKTQINSYSAQTLTNINSRLLTTTFNTFTGTTLPANYYNKTQINSYTGQTLTNINSRLLTTVFNTFTGTTLPANYYNKIEINSYTGQTLTNFNTFTGTTLPANYYNKTQINSYTGQTDSRLDTIETKYVTGATNGLTCIANNRICLGGILSAPLTTLSLTSPVSVFQVCFTGNSALVVAGAGTAMCTCGAGILLNGDVSIGSCSNDNLFMGTGGTIFCSNANNAGIQYNSDYSANYNNRSLVDKEYVDSTNGITGATNGLTLYGNNNVGLGGVLYNITTIDLNERELNFLGDTYVAFSAGTGFNNEIIDVLVQPDKKLVFSGYFTAYSGASRNHIIRLDSDGSIDNSFIIGTGFDGTYIQTIARQNDGKLLFGGDFTSYSGVSRNRIIRLNSDGSVDNTFVIGSGFNSSVWKIVIQPDGKILATGNFITYSGTSAVGIIRLNSNGSIDNTFDIGSGFSGGGAPLTMFINSSGMIFAGGSFGFYSGQSVNYAVRLNSNGSIDNTFNTGSGFNNFVRTGIFQTDEKLILGGDFTSYNGTTVGHIVRLNVNGSIDSMFDTGTGFNGDVEGMSIQEDGKVVISGTFTSYDGVLANNIIRLNIDGSVDDTFQSGSGLGGGFANVIDIKTNGKMILGGDFTSYSGQTANYIIRLNNDGTINMGDEYEIIFNRKVIEYGDDYSSIFTNRSLVDKEYVDNAITSGTSVNAITGATNGLCKYDTQNICIGGLLTNADTNLFLTGNSFNVYGNSVGLFLNETFGSCSAIICGSGATICLNSCAVISSNYGDKLEMCPTRTVFCSVTGGGIKYNANYCGGYTARSLVDKEYVDNKTNTYSVTAITGNVTLTTGSSYVILANNTGSTITITLPATPNNGRAFKIKDNGGNALINNVIVDAGVGITIDGTQCALINTNNGAIEIMYSSLGVAGWNVLSFVN